MLPRKQSKGKWRKEENETDLGDKFADGNVEEHGWVTGMPFSVPFFKLELHQVACDGGDEHIARLTSNGIVELENLVVPRATFANSEALVPGENGGHRFRHRWLLCYIENGNRTATGHRYYCTAGDRVTGLRV